MTTITPELQALADAALQVSDHIDARRTECISEPEQHLSSAAAAYRASIASKECRPPAGAKDGSLWWLVRTLQSGTIERRVFSWTHELWYAFGNELSTPLCLMHNLGWTVHGECVFPGERVAATDEEIVKFLRGSKHSAVTLENTPDRYRLEVFGRTLIREAVAHFASPKLRSISDEKIDEIMYVEWSRSGPIRTKDALRNGARAVEAYIKGERE